MKIRGYLIKQRFFSTSFLFLTILLSLITDHLSAREVHPKIDMHHKQLRSSQASATDPIVYYAAHSRGNIQLVVGNNGQFGTFGGTIVDPISGQQIQSCIYPKNSEVVYLWVGALWIGAIVGRDTLVSCATEDFYQVREFWPNPGDSFSVESIDESSPFFSETANSEEDIISVYTDTFTSTHLTGTDTYNAQHKPLNIKVFQRSMAWSYEYADDFILFDYQIENIGTKKLEQVYMGIYVDGDAWHKTNEGPQGWNDDIVGFVREFDAPEGYGFKDTVNIAYNADNNGDPTGGEFDENSCRSVVGTRVIRTPSDSLSYSFNWWTIDYGDPSQDFGPRKFGVPGDPYRDFGRRSGTPEGDKNKYYVMRHKEFDYDLLFTAVDHTDEGYIPPPPNPQRYAYGYDTRYLLSFGPFDINPGEKLPITFACVGGEELHRDPNAFNSFDINKPQNYYNQLNFSNLASNSRWASWVYDNPGVDTDGDGDFGKFRVINYDSTLITVDTVLDGVDTVISYYRYNSADTSYYEGDGVPDFKGASPPPAPDFWILPDVQKVRIRFNGLRSELAEDQFSGVQDFEGFRVYMGRDNLKSSYSLISSYDLENYNKYVYNFNKLPEPAFELLEAPFLLEELQCLYGDSCSDEFFNPEIYTQSRPFVHPDFPDSVFYFAAQDYNVSELGVETDIKKRFPNQPYPSHLNPDSAQQSELTEDGYFKYFEYELEIDNILATVDWWFNVTAFDYGSPEVGLASLESSVVNGAKRSLALYDLDELENNYDKIYTYPNPYRLDVPYRKELGFEGRDNTTGADNRVRAIHFVNIPPQCTIKIFSLDGDLIREIIHDTSPGDPHAGHDEWDLITRNTQEIVSGLYYYVVEWDEGSFIGKFVIIM